MDPRRVFMALGAAVFLAALVTFFVYRRLASSMSHTATTQVLVASKDVPVGAALTADDVTTANWPANVPLPGSFQKADQVLGRPPLYPISSGEPLLDHDLAVPGSGLGLSVKIPSGMRATSVKSNEVVGVAGFLYPGSHVDVLGTFHPSGPNNSNNPVTQTILQNVEVLTAGQTIEPNPTGKPETVNVVTLLLNPEDSQKLLLASTEGSIQFVMRNGADQTQANPAATSLNEMLAGAKPPAPVKVARRVKKQNVAPAAPPPPPPYVVEVIQGEKHSVEKF